MAHEIPESPTEPKWHGIEEPKWSEFDTCTFSIERDVWMVRWQGSVLRPTFNSKGAADAFIAGLRAGRKPS